MIADYLNQRVLWKRRTGGDDWQGATYSDPVEIPARVEERVRVMGGAGGSEVRATNEVTVAEDVRIGDFINWRDLDPEGSFDEVQTRNSEVDLFGGVEDYVLFFEPVSRS